MSDRSLNAAAQRVLRELGAKPSQRPSFDVALRQQLFDQAQAGLAAISADVDVSDPFFVSKHHLANVHACQVRLLGEEELGFSWSVPLARGTVAHKALELSLFMEEATALDLVDAAIGSLTQADQSISDFLANLSSVESAELRGSVLDAVSAYFEGFPPLRRHWQPVFESRRRVELLQGAVVWSAKFDLTLGRSEGQVAGKAIVDFKTGGTNQNHVDDLRFYALLETLRYGVPPRMVASYYLDSGELVTEKVTVGTLEAALVRAVRGTLELFGLRTGLIEPRLVPTWACNWCPLRPECEAGQAYLSSTP